MRKTQAFWNLLKKVRSIMINFVLHKNFIDQETIIGSRDENKVPGPRLRYTAFNAILGSRNIVT